MSNTGWTGLCNEVVPDCIGGLLAACGVPAEYSGPKLSLDGRASGIVASIGFTSVQLTGTLTLSTTPEVIVSAGATSDSERDVMDWAGELANQALGRIKNRLLHYDVKLVMATPIAVTGTRLYPRAAKGGRSYFSFITPGGTIDVHLGAAVDESFVWTMMSEPDGAPAEGDFLTL